MVREKLLFSVCLVLLNVVFNSHTTFAQIINDPLQGSTTGTKVGGTFTSEGYMPGLGQNHILYVVPSQVVNGYIEFEMKGFWPDDIVGENNDHGFIIMYDARGIGNTPTWEEFRDNYFRWNFHWRQNASIFKCVVNCAAPTSIRLNSTYAVFLDGRDWYDEPTGSGFTWDSNKTQWYTVKIEWNNKTFKVFVDGNLVWVNHVPSPYDYAPIDHRIWLGSGVDKYNSDVSDVVYRNFKLFSYAPQYISPIITSSPIISGLVGESYSYDVNATGNPSPTYSLTTAPAGMTIDLNNGLIEWVPTAEGNFDVTVNASNGVNPDAIQNFTISIQQPLYTPSNLLAFLSPSDTQKVKLVWNDNSTNEIGFVIERKTGDSLSVEPFAIIDSVGANINDYIDSTVENSTTYTYRIFAFNEDTTSNYSNIAEVVTSVPVELLSFYAKVIGGSVLLGWETASELNNAGFYIQRAAENNNYQRITFVKGNGTTTKKSSYVYYDKSPLHGKYNYRLEQLDLDGTISYSYSIETDLGEVVGFSIEQNYPNPFNPTTTIRFSITQNASVKIILHNSLGQELATLMDSELTAGVYEKLFDASTLASGVYFYEILAQNYNGILYKFTKRMMLMK